MPLHRATFEHTARWERRQRKKKFLTLVTFSKSQCVFIQNWSTSCVLAGSGPYHLSSNSWVMSTMEKLHQAELCPYTVRIVQCSNWDETDAKDSSHSEHGLFVSGFCFELHKVINNLLENRGRLECQCGMCLTHTLCAANRTNSENENDEEEFLFWHSPELQGLLWPHRVYKAQQGMSDCQEWVTTIIPHFYLNPCGVVPCQPILKLPQPGASLVCQKRSRSDLN